MTVKYYQKYDMFVSTLVESDFDLYSLNILKFFFPKNPNEKNNFIKRLKAILSISTNYDFASFYYFTTNYDIFYKENKIVYLKTYWFSREKKFDQFTELVEGDNDIKSITSLLVKEQHVDIEVKQLTDKSVINNEINRYIKATTERVKLLQESLETDLKSADKQIKEMFNPQKIYKTLNNHVIGQDKAKRTISVAISNHMRRIIHNDNNTKKDNIQIEKSNVLLIGPSGCGKTEIARTIAKEFNLPFVTIDATNYTETGYVGADVNDIISELYKSSNFSIELTERGIIYIDEIDKITAKNNNSSSKDPSGLGLQRVLLKLMEGSIVEIPANGATTNKHLAEKVVRIDTKNILFICAGAFYGIDKIVDEGINKKSVGFGVSNEKYDPAKFDYSKVTAEHIIKYGLLPEFVGRLPVLTYVNKLTNEELRRVLTEPKNAIIKQYQALFKVDNIDLTFTDDALNNIIDKYSNNGVGARGLRSLLENELNDIMFDMSSKEDLKSIIIDKDFNNPIYKYNEENEKKEVIPLIRTS
jgi:ATP-dependent Clp protease ATP-binding subunit ClpX